MGTTALSREDQVREILRCGKDPVFFMKKYVKIQHPKRGIIPFETYSFQDDCVKAFEDCRFNIVLKSRQLGLSTVSAAYAAWLAIFHRDKTVLVIATKLPTAMNFIKKIRVILTNVPGWLLLPKFEPTKQAITFNNGSSITAIPTSDDAGRSEALSLLIVDEAAFIRDFEDIWTGLSPTISTGGRAIIISTPNGVGGQYYKLWTDAEAHVNDFNAIKLSWNVHPEHDEDWFKSETKSLSRRKIAQEYLCDFIASGDTFLQPNDLEFLRTTIKPPIDKFGDKRDIWVWVHPQVDKRYIVSADVSRGDARDFSAFHVIDTTNSEVVAEYMGKVPPEKLADILCEWGKKYNNALIIPENNSYGYFVSTKLRDTLSYPSLYYHSNKGDPFAHVQVNHGDDKELPGFPTNQKTRIQILAKLEELIRNKTIKLYSQRLYDQLQSFIWNGSKPMATKDSYDDLVMALAIGAWLLEGRSGLSEQAIAMSMAILKATTMERRDVNQMPGDIQSAQPLVNPNIRGYNHHTVFRPRDASQVKHNDASDFSWLLR